jgi:hypothetical protein
VSVLELLPAAITYLVWIAIFTTGMRNLSVGKRLTAVAVVAGALQIPVWGTTPFYYLRGVLGDFSVTHALWALAALGHRISRSSFFVIPQKQKITVALLLVTVAACFYPSALGATDFDIYRLGFAPLSMLAVLAAIALVAWQLRAYFLLMAIVTSVFVFKFQILESSNLWDYLFDPVLVIYCAVWLFATLLKFVFQRVMQRPVQPLPYGPVAAT